MSEIQRYEQQGSFMVTEPDGEYVLYADYEAAIALLEARFTSHTDAVSGFLTVMYQTMIDPLDDPDPQMKVASMCELLLHQAREDREKLNRSPANFPADWNQDSSLETWFPLTAEELSAARLKIEQLEAQVAKLKADLASTEESLEAQQAKYDGCPHKPIERIGGDLCDTCGCSLDRIGDVCCLHAPALDKAQAQVARLRQEIDLRVEQGAALNQDKEHFKAQVARLSAPVSDEEIEAMLLAFFREAVGWPCSEQWIQHHWSGMVAALAILAARLSERDEDISDEDIIEANRREPSSAAAQVFEMLDAARLSDKEEKNGTRSA